MKRPELEANYLGIFQIFKNLDEARKTVAAADKCEDPSDAIFYRGALDKLVRLEAQADALTVAFQVPRAELRKWLDDMVAFYKELEARP